MGGEERMGGGGGNGRRKRKWEEEKGMGGGGEAWEGNMEGEGHHWADSVHFLLFSDMRMP